MDSVNVSMGWYQRLAQKELQEIKERVHITSYLGAEAYVDSERVRKQRKAEAQFLVEAITVNPTTGRANNIDGFVEYINNIITEPHSYLALADIIDTISIIAKQQNYPRCDRKTIAKVFRHLRLNGHIDNCMQNMLYGVEETIAFASSRYGAE